MPHTIAENLERLTEARTDIANAIIAKGGTVASGDGFEEFPYDIESIPLPVTEQLTVTENGTYTVPEGVDGYSSVTVEVETGMKAFIVTFSIDNSGVITADKTYNEIVAAYEDGDFIYGDISGLGNIEPYLLDNGVHFNALLNSCNSYHASGVERLGFDFIFTYLGDGDLMLYGVFFGYDDITYSFQWFKNYE